MSHSRVKFKFPTAEELGINLDDVSVEELAGVFANSGLRRGGKFSEWISWRFKQLHEFRIEAHLERLAKIGVCRETIGLSMFLIQLAPAIDHMFKDLFGSKQTRIRNARSLARAAALLESMSKLLPDMPEMAMEIPSPSMAARSVRHYSTMLVWGEAVYGFLGAKSIVEVAKYSLAGLIKRGSGKFHDREVSALVGAGLYDFDYDETAHRVWRIRNYERLEKSFSIGPKVLQGLNDVLLRE